MNDAAKKLREEIDVLEAERILLTVKLRNALLRTASELLPEAIRQARPRRAASSKKGTTGRPGSPALLRLIARLAMRPAAIERAK